MSVRERVRAGVQLFKQSVMQLLFVFTQGGRYAMRCAMCCSRAVVTILLGGWDFDLACLVVLAADLAGWLQHISCHGMRKDEVCDTILEFFMKMRPSLS